MTADSAARWPELAAQLARETGAQVRAGQPLAPHTTMRVGGPADLLATARSVDQLVALIAFARRAAIPFVVLGRASNLVIADAGIRGLAIVDRAEGHRVESGRLIAESGLPFARAAMIAAAAGLSGLEFGIAIPGTVGGAVWANAGAHGSDVAAILESARILHPDGATVTEPAAALNLTYRDSRLKASGAGRGGAGTSPGGAGTSPGGHPTSQEIVLEATFHLEPADAPLISARLDEIRHWRREHQPLTVPSAGSFFRNPPGDSAGRLIDAAGLKGLRVGGASVSRKHANFIVNDAQASAADILRLAETVREKVARDFGVELVYEVQFLGDWSSDEKPAVPITVAGAATETSGAQEER